MNRIALSLLIIGCLLSCHQKEQLGKPLPKVKPRVQQQAAPENWIDPMMANYIRHAKNPLIRAKEKNQGAEEWLLDRTEKTDTATYLVFHIGHDFEDADGKRFATDGWVYLDSIRRILYEYDLPNDRLIRWER